MLVGGEARGPLGGVHGDACTGAQIGFLNDSCARVESEGVRGPSFGICDFYANRDALTDLDRCGFKVDL
jgi:hypothetical protein